MSHLLVILELPGPGYFPRVNKPLLRDAGALRLQLQLFALIDVCHEVLGRTCGKGLCLVHPCKLRAWMLDTKQELFQSLFE